MKYIHFIISILVCINLISCSSSDRTDEEGGKENVSERKGNDEQISPNQTIELNNAIEKLNHQMKDSKRNFDSIVETVNSEPYKIEKMSSFKGDDYDTIIVAE